MKVYGPYKRDKDRRSGVIIHYDDGRKVTKSYPRCLYETYHKVVLKPWEDVHHKDEDVDNNAIDNLEIINSNVHMDLFHSYGEKYSEYICPECDEKFTRKKRHADWNIKQGRDGPFCTRHCAGTWNGRKRKAPVLK